MSKLISLIRTDLNITFGLSSIIHGFKAKKNRWQLIIIPIAILSLIPTYVLFIRGLWSFYDVLSQIGQQSYFLLMGFLGSQLMVFFFGLMYVMSKYYFSNDLNHLVPLPIKPSQILTSKFVTIMVSEYLTSLPLFLPFVIIYGLKTNGGLVYWIYSLLGAIFLPVIPLVISSLVIMILMKYTNIKGKRDQLRIAAAGGFIILMIWFQLKIQQISQNAILEGENFMFNLARDANLLVKSLGMAFPPSMWGALSLANYKSLLGLTNILLYSVVSIIFFVLMIVASEKLFFDGLIGNIEVSASKGRNKNKNLDKTIVARRAYIAIAVKEIKMLFKTPIYLMNSVGGVIIVPVILVMSLVTGEASMAPISELISTNMDIVVLIGVAMIGILGMLNCVGVTTFSREGSNFWIMRTLPIKAEDQILGRLLASLFIQVIGALVLIISIFFIIRLDLISITLIILLGLLASIPMTLLGMIIDIIRPLLTWTNPQQAMKQNFNVLIGMGLATIYGGALFFLIKLILNKLDIVFVYLILVWILIISSLIFFKILKSLIEKRFKELE